MNTKKSFRKIYQSLLGGHSSGPTYKDSQKPYMSNNISQLDMEIEFFRKFKKNTPQLIKEATNSYSEQMNVN